MKVLHIMRSKPDKVTEGLMESASKDKESEEMRLYRGVVDYDRLLKAIFNSQAVISWW